MKRTIIMMAALTFSLALFMPPALASSALLGTTVQDPTPEEAAAYKAWFDANNAKDYPKAMELAKAYLEKLPSGKYAAYLKDKWIPSLNPFFFNKAVESKNVAEIIRIGKEVLARDADNLDYLSALVVQIRTLELFATPPNYAHSAEAGEFAERAIKLIEAGKTPTGADPTKFNKNVTLAYLHQTLAVIYEHDKNTDKALAEYDKSASLDPSNATFFFHCGRIHNDKYAAAAQKYDAAQKKADAIPDADRKAADPKPEVKAAVDEAKNALTEVNGQADAVINCWARFLGLTVKNNPWGATRAQIEKAFTDLYKYRHNDSTDGMQKLIDDNAASATPVKMTPPPEVPSKPAGDQSAAAKPAGKKQP